MTKRSSRQRPEIRDFILRNVSRWPNSIIAHAVDEFGLSRAGIYRYVARLQKEGLLSASGRTRARHYRLALLINESFKIQVFYGLPEDQIWRFRVLPYLDGVLPNIVQLCKYGFTEMLNNVIDHSVSKDCIIVVRRTYLTVEFFIIDHGVGIFEKLKTDFNLDDSRSALLELSKGKLTSDQKRHAGEGIFFTSRMFDHFSINSGNLYYTRDRQIGDEWLIETGDRSRTRAGTAITFKINTDADWTTNEVFETYLSGHAGFRKTHVPVKLGLYPNDELVSRSQAKRVLARFERFSEVMLDFEGVPSIGQPFADEIFRVFVNEHPDITVTAIRTNRAVQRVIDYVVASAAVDVDQRELPL